MPYLPVDMDGKRRAALVDLSLGLPRGACMWGLLELWEHVWRSRSGPTPDLVAPMFLVGCFGPDERIRLALVDAGFLEPQGDRYRVKGARKWLLGLEGRSRGGHAAKSNLIPGAAHLKRAASVGAVQPNNQPNDATRQASTMAHTSSAPAEGAHGLGIEGPSAPSSIQHPASEKKKRAGVPPAAPKKETDWRMKPTIGALCGAYLKARGVKYPFDHGKEAKCVQRLLARAPPETLLPAWTRALAEGGYPKVATLLEFERALPHFLGTAPTQTGQRRPTGADPNQGILTRERVETAEEIEEANRRAEEWVNGG